MSTWESIQELFGPKLSLLPVEQGRRYGNYQYNSIYPMNFNFIRSEMYSSVLFKPPTYERKPTTLYALCSQTDNFANWTLFEDEISLWLYDSPEFYFKMYWDAQGKLTVFQVSFVNGAHALYFPQEIPERQCSFHGNPSIFAGMPTNIANRHELLGQCILWEIDFPVVAERIFELSEIAKFFEEVR